ncbi:MAG: Hpt domain-containing protein, partial [Methanosarcinales archaeon]|nr:Hpt domain-containing protein [Methanosarcinales archaeon]
VGKLIDDCKSETGDIMTNINIGGNGNIVTVGDDNQIVSLHSIKELDELIQRLKTNSHEEYAEQLENARKSNDVHQIKSILSKLKNVVSGSAEMMGMINKIIPILSSLKDSSL